MLDGGGEKLNYGGLISALALNEIISHQRGFERFSSTSSTPWWGVEEGKLFLFKVTHRGGLFAVVAFLHWNPSRTYLSPVQDGEFWCPQGRPKNVGKIVCLAFLKCADFGGFHANDLSKWKNLSLWRVFSAINFVQMWLSAVRENYSVESFKLS